MTADSRPNEPTPSRRSCSCTGPSPTPPAGTASSSGSSAKGYSVVAPANPLRGVGHRFRLPGQRGQPARWSRAAGRALLRRGGHHQRRHRCRQRGRPGVRGGVRPDTDERLGDVAASSKDSLLGTAQVQRVSDGTRRGDSARVPGRSRTVPGGLRRRPAGGAGRGAGRHPAPRRRRGVQRCVRTAGLEDTAILGGGRHRRQGRRQRPRPFHGPAARRRDRRGRRLARGHGLATAGGGGLIRQGARVPSAPHGPRRPCSPAATGQHDDDDGGDRRLVRRAQADRRRPLERWLRRGRSLRRPSGDPAARLALRHPQLCRRRPVAGLGGLPGDRAVPARLRDNALPVGGDGPQRPAVGARGRRHRPDGCPRHRSAILAGFDWGGADGRHRRGALAGALQGPRLGERLPDRQPGGQRQVRCRQRPSSSGGTSTTSPPNAAGSATPSTGATSPSSSGRSLRRSGSSTTPPSIAARRPSTTPITSRSSSTTTAGGWAWPKARQTIRRIWRSSSPRSGHRRADHHPRRRRQRRPPTDRAPMPESSSGRVFPPDSSRGCRAQPAPGSPGRVRRRRPRSRRSRGG